MYRWVEHTAELELAIEAATREAVLADALAALRELHDPEEAAARSEEREVAVTAADPAALLAGWLEELVYLAESAGFVAEALVECRFTDDGLETVLRGGRGEPRPIVKAVTYHRLAFHPVEAGYVATVVLDV
jgi:SHS2 domain-containing protein